jgi:predicted phage gp36 major capsid-like protein
MRLDVRCDSAPWENTTCDADEAYDLAYNLAEEYQQPVDLFYNSTGTLYTQVFP